MATRKPLAIIAGKVKQWVTGDKLPYDTLPTGTGANTVAAGDDARLSDAREWSAQTVDQPEAEAGTAVTRRAWTAQRVRQAWTAAWNAARTSLAAINSSAITEANVAVVVQTDIGTDDNQVPLNAYLGGLAYMSPDRFVLKPQASVTPAAPGDLVFELTSDTTLTVRARGSDGVVRSATLTLS